MVKDVVEYIDEGSLESIKDILKENRPIVNSNENIPDPRPHNNTGRMEEELQYERKDNETKKTEEAV